MKRKLVLKPFVLPTLYVMLIVGIMMFTASALYQKNESKENDVEYVSDTIFENTTPVVNTLDKYVLAPYSGDEVEEKIGYYNYKGEKKSQEKSIIQYESTYLQNTGITYYSTKEFKVIAIMDGTVTKIYDNDILGNVIEITHDNGLISVYQMVNEIKVKKGDTVKAGDEIAKSGTSKLSPKGSNLHFEVLKDGITRDPNSVIGNNTKDL